MYEDLTFDLVTHPDFDSINELQIFDCNFAIDFPFADLSDMSVKFN
jgi:hypothetical protein